jgi:acetylornithine deacetylase/succinyl-diaminopimelate desuccinylase-like protein
MQSERNILYQDSIALLQSLITIPSFSKEEAGTASCLQDFLEKKGITAYRQGNNIYALSQDFTDQAPTLLLNSHHDTVRPNAQYSRDPFLPTLEEGKLYGLGSNDAGASLVSLIAAFCHWQKIANQQGWNLVFAATAEEEISGSGGIESLLQDEAFISNTKSSFLRTQLHPLTTAIVGEPTLLQMAVAERGLMVLDAVVSGKAGHAAREEGDNAIYRALKDIAWFKEYQFNKVSPLLGPNKMTVTVIETLNKAHNQVPPDCHFVIDTRINECYTFEEVLAEIRQHTTCQIKPRSTRLSPTMIALDHPLVKAGHSLGLSHYGSPTTSDKALIPFSALKLGPGNSARSHSADEFVYVAEIEKGIDLYIDLIGVLFTSNSL